jgi:hypothetical protein
VDLLDTKEAVEGIHICLILLSHSSHLDQIFRVAFIVEIEVELHFIFFYLGYSGNHQLEGPISVRAIFFLFFLNILSVIRTPSLR